MTNNKISCPFCSRKYIFGNKKDGKDALYNHMETEHKDELHGLPAAQVYFNWKNRYALTKGFGKSVMSGKPTKFNLATERYDRFLPEEAEAYRNMFKQRMIKIYGKESLMNDMEHQKKMLANRRISGTYEFSDGSVKTYTGSYERDFLEFLDLYLGYSGSSVIAPAPQIFPYTLDGVPHSHIPDFYLQDLNLIVNIKSSDNQHYRARDIEIENIEDEQIKRSNFNYIKIFDKDYDNFYLIVDKIKKGKPGQIFRI